MFDKDNSTNADILWTLKVIMNRFSFPSSMGLDKLFKAMFPDSEIAEQFTPLQPGVAFLYPMKMFSGVIAKQHWAVMG